MRRRRAVSFNKLIVVLPRFILYTYVYYSQRHSVVRLWAASTSVRHHPPVDHVIVRKEERSQTIRRRV